MQSRQLTSLLKNASKRIYVIIMLEYVKTFTVKILRYGKKAKAKIKKAKLLTHEIALKLNLLVN